MKAIWKKVLWAIVFPILLIGLTTVTYLLSNGFLAFVVFVVCISAGTFVLVKIILREEEDSKEEKNKELSDLSDRAVLSLSGFEESKRLQTPNGEMVSIDATNDKFFYWAKDKQLLFGFEDIISSEIKENGELVVSSQKSGSLGRAIAGGVIAGGVGAIVGSGSAKTISNSQTKVTSLDVYVVLNNIESSSIVLHCLECHCAKGDEVYNRGLDLARKLNDVFSIAKGKVKKSTKIDDLKELIGLKESGAITEEEFKTLKANLIN